MDYEAELKDLVVPSSSEVRAPYTRASIDEIAITPITSQETKPPRSLEESKKLTGKIFIDPTTIPGEEDK